MAPTAGISFKPEHFEQAMNCSANGLWFEVHAENYMVDGGIRLTMLDALRRHFPISIHGVGLSLAGVEEPDRGHLAKLKRLCDRIEPFLVSEHLAWSHHDGISFPDLLPFPRTTEALEIIIRNIDIAQEALGRTILVENPALYLELEGHDWSEPAFLTELVQRSGCGLLADVNNLVVSSSNLDFDPVPYIDELPVDAIGEIHLAGHAADPLLGPSLLIDSHDSPVTEEVWGLYERLLSRCNDHAPPTLIEWDDQVPEFDTLLAERDRAAVLLAARHREDELIS